MAIQLEIANQSDTGRRRPHNEDSTLSNTQNGVVVLADGMGGYKAGEVASALAANAIYHEISTTLESNNLGSGSNESAYSPETQLVKDSIIHANSDIYNTATKDPQCQGMGTTIVVALFHEDKISIGHVGDSRLYRKRGNDFRQITKDHSLIQELIDRGMYTPEEAEANTPKNLVTRALGIDALVEVDVQEIAAEEGDIFMLCSDGLTDMVDDEEIHLTLSKYSANLGESAEELVYLANRKGGKDNISVILIRVLGSRAGSGGSVADIFKRLIKRN
jgi:protein phosphatase